MLKNKSLNTGESSTDVCGLNSDVWDVGGIFNLLNIFHLIVSMQEQLVIINVLVN